MSKFLGNRSIQIVLPMAGLGTRFAEAGYQVAKPLLPIHDQPMFKVVLGNVLSPQVKRVVIISRLEWNLTSEIEELNSNSDIDFKLVEIDYTTEGPADTVVLAAPHLELDLPVVTANSDQYVCTAISDFFSALLAEGVAGTIMTMEDDDPKWSFVQVDSSGDVVNVREKEVISHQATVGIYGFTTASVLLESINKMKLEGDRVNGEFYIAPVYNYMIRDGQRVTTFETGAVEDVMFGLGIPKDYENFIRHPESKVAAGSANSLH